MDFEDILKEVGDFGLYQKILVIAFMIPCFIVIAWFSTDYIFLIHTPDHWCYVPEVVSSNLSLDLQKQLVRPLQDSSCSMYDLNYSQILQSGNWTIETDWPTRPCSDGWQYDTSIYDATAVTRWNMVCQDGHYSSLVVSLIYLGNVLGTPFFGFMSDRWGRKPTFLFLAALIAVTEISSVMIPIFALFIVLWMVIGSTISTIYRTAYIIFLELVKPDIRGCMNGLATTSWTIGLCLLPLVAWLTADWKRLTIVCTAAATGLLFYSKWVPESPSWLIAEERYEEAADIMAKISKVNGMTGHEGSQLLEKIQKLGEKIKKQKIDEKKPSPMDFFKYPTMRKRFLIITICWIGTSIPYIGVQINVKNLAGSEFLNFFLLSLIEVPAHFITWLWMERIGRRWCTVCAFAISTIACAMPVIFPPEYALVGVIASLIAKIGTCAAFMTWYQQSPELFPTSHRGIGLGLSSTIGNALVLLVPYIVYLAKFGTYLPFLIFSIVTFISGICASFLPETLNKKLPQTVNDAENFERNFKFFSCTGTHEAESDSEMIQISCTPAMLSVADSASHLKKYDSFSEPVTDLPALKKSTYEPSGCEILAGINPST